jgi:hypothetical protein
VIEPCEEQRMAEIIVCNGSQECNFFFLKKVKTTHLVENETANNTNTN